VGGGGGGGGGGCVGGWGGGGGVLCMGRELYGVCVIREGYNWEATR